MTQCIIVELPKKLNVLLIFKEARVTRIRCKSGPKRKPSLVATSADCLAYHLPRRNTVNPHDAMQAPASREAR